MTFIKKISIFIFILLLAGCQRGQSQDLSEINIDLSVTPDPPAVGEARVQLTLTDAAGQPVEGATIELEGNMNHAGMTPVFAEASEAGPGQYEAPLEFTMGGDWFIIVKATLPDGRTLERQIELPGVQTE